ncbi:MAG: leucine-rich repeat domain-containing protein [Clostridia bacterium]|nr:leucine-rich repeat domain-containing protein [Clostridia bacterium]
MKKAKSLCIFSLCLVLCAGFFACDNEGNNSASNGGNSNTHDGGVYTEFTAEEEALFTSSFGFVIPFVQNSGYTVSDYEGYNGDLTAYENGLVFVAEGLTEEDCQAYVDNLKADENYSFEYPQDGYYYFSRDGYFVKVDYYWMKTQFGLTVYTYSYTFENVDSSDTATDGDSSDTGTDIPDEPTVGFKYEKHSDSYSIVGFYGDEDGVVEIPDFYEGLPVRYIRGNAFYGAEEITEVIVGNNVLSIEGNAFMLCSNLEKVTLGNSLTLIDRQTFLGCEKLEEITIPATVTFIGAGAFRNCTKLKSVFLGNPEGWHTSSNLHEDFPVEDMSNAETVAEYFTETYVSEGWLKD